MLCTIRKSWFYSGRRIRLFFGLTFHPLLSFNICVQCSGWSCCVGLEASIWKFLNRENDARDACLETLNTSIQSANSISVTTSNRYFRSQNDRLFRLCWEKSSFVLAGSFRRAFHTTVIGYRKISCKKSRDFSTPSGEFRKNLCLGYELFGLSDSYPATPSSSGDRESLLHQIVPRRAQSNLWVTYAWWFTVGSSRHMCHARSRIKRSIWLAFKCISQATYDIKGQGLCGGLDWPSKVLAKWAMKALFI